MLSAETSSLVLLACALAAAAMALGHALAALRDAWMARVERLAVTQGAALREGVAAVRGVVAADDDGSPVATVAVAQALVDGRRWREFAPRSRHARPFSLTLDDGVAVRVEVPAGVTLHAPLVSVTPVGAGDGLTRTLVAQVAAGQRVTALGSLARHDALAPPAGGRGDYRSAAPGSAWTLRGFAGRPPLVSAEEPGVARALHARRNGRFALAWCALLLASQGGLRAEGAWAAARSERVTARSLGCSTHFGRRSPRPYYVSRFRLPSGDVVRVDGCWEEGRDRSVLVTRDHPPALAIDQAPAELSMAGLAWLALSLGLPGLILAVRARAELPWYRARRHEGA